MVKNFLLLLTSALLVAALPRNQKRTVCASSQQTVNNAACCVWFDVREELLNNIFFNTCADNVHGNVRLAFHDAVGFSQALANAGKFPGGGADGSIVLFPAEQNFTNTDGQQPNAGLNENADFIAALVQHHGVSAGDAIQFAMALGLTLCPGGPVVPFFAGRPNATAISPQNLVPTPNHDVTSILARMLDLGPSGFSAQQTVTLLGAHTAGDQSFVDLTNQNQPFDSTPFIWDNQVFLEVLLENNPGGPITVGGNLQQTGVFRLASDALFARDPRTACFWQQFVGNHDVFVNQFEQFMFQLGIVGQDEAKLIDCSDTIPATAAPLLTPEAFFPPGFSMEDVQVSCDDGSEFPALTSVSGAQVSTLPIPDQDVDDP
jgi:cytochrome c peroxidase